MKRIYVAGPYSSCPVTGVRNACQAADAIVECGHAAYIPHLTMLWDLVTKKSYEEWLAIDLAWLPVCDAVLRLPGKSAGADREVAMAADLGIPVFTSFGELQRWLLT